MRLRELEIHHVDLGAGYTTARLVLDFADHLLDAMTKRLEPPERFEVRPLDSGRTSNPRAGRAAWPSRRRRCSANVLDQSRVV